MIHSLGMDSVPVDELSNGPPAADGKLPIEAIPSVELASAHSFSTRLFEVA